MTLTYQNLNWWGRPDTWTEFCAILDSLMLSVQLYQATGEEDYRVPRVWHDGFAMLPRANSGAGMDTIVSPRSPWVYLASSMHETCFCCTMRLAWGLCYAGEHADLLWAEVAGGGGQYVGPFVQINGRW